MVKKDDSGAGLRAGYVREEAKPKTDGHTAAREKKESKAITPEAVPEKPAHDGDDASGPTITMQGVSGKKITGVVKVVKVNKAEKEAKAKTESETAVNGQSESKPELPADQRISPEAIVDAPSKTSVKTEIEKAEKESLNVQAETKSVETDKKVRKTAKKEKESEPEVIKTASVIESEPAGSAEKTAGKVESVENKPADSAAISQKPADAGSSQQEQPVKTQQGRPAAQGAASSTARPPIRPQQGNYVRRQPGERVDRPQADRPLNSYSSDRPQPGQYGYRPQQSNYQGRPQGGGYQGRPQGEGYQGRPQSGGYQGRPQGGGYQDRPQGGGYQGRPQGEGYQGRPQGGGYQGRPQGGGYQGRPQGGGYQGRPQGGGYQNNRFQSGFPDKDADDQNDRSKGNRSQSPRKKSGSGLPSELKEALPQTPRSNFAARDAYDKGAKRDDKRDVKKDSIKSAVDLKDKHNLLKQQAAVLSGQGVDALNDEVILDAIYKAPVKGRGRLSRNNRRSGSQSQSVKAVLTHVKLPESLTVKEFSEAIKKTSAEVIKKLMKLGVMATLNQDIDYDTAELLANEFGITTEKLIEVTEEDILFDDSDDDDKDLKTRPPVVVVMGHVDHGKTSILDHIRSASVASGEAGGITQHIGAYTVKTKGRQITFLDTPGHEAFTTMRARGAQVTDIAILVVAADDGVMPQTIEAINHARAAGTEIIVAINKIDKEGANIDRVKQELSKYELIPEEWGGQTVMVPVSALKGSGMDDLLEMVLLTADVMDLKANPDKQAKGTVIEAKLDKNRGPVATVLVQRGTLRTGDTLVSGSIIGHVRAMTDDKGHMVKKAGPSVPVEILGMPEVPEAGDIFYAVTDEKVARNLADRRKSQQREHQLRASSRMSLDTLFSQMAAGEVKDLNIIIKADVQGSVEAVRQSLEKLNDGEAREVRVNVVHGAVGAITETDIRLAEVSNAIVIGFNVRPAANVAELAKEIGVDLRMYRVIYNAIEDIEAAMKGMLAPKFEENVLGHAKVRQVFKVSGVGTIAGCYVTDGKILRSSEVRIVRDGIVIHEGKLSSLKRFKDDAREVATGYECGIGIERFNDIKENDVIEAFEMKEIERS
jgi:translation initiation factor IF-2